jgi:ketosteroid isomerase-like protein
MGHIAGTDRLTTFVYGPATMIIGVVRENPISRGTTAGAIRASFLWMKATFYSGLIAIARAACCWVSAVVGNKSSDDARLNEIRSLTAAYTEAHLRMDNAAITATWADDVISLLPGMDPLIGKPAIAKFIEDTVARTPGYKVIRQENDFGDITVSGDWATEWATTHQVVQQPEGKPIDLRQDRARAASLCTRKMGSETRMWN